MSATLISLGVIGGVRFAFDLATTPWARMDAVVRLNFVTAALGACAAISLGTSLAVRALRRRPAQSFFEEIRNEPETPNDSRTTAAEGEPRAAAS